MFHYSYFLFWGIDIQPLFIMNRQSLPPSPLFQSDPKNEKSIKSGPELNHYYISYSDIKIKYRWNRGNGPLISLDHVRIRRPVESSCSWMLHKKNSYSFPPPRKVHSKSQEQSFFFFMVMQCKRSEIRLFLMMKSFFYVKFLKTRNLKVGNVRRRLSWWSDTYGRYIFESSDRENKRTPRRLLKALSANQKDWSCWILLSTTII